MDSHLSETDANKTGMLRTRIRGIAARNKTAMQVRKSQLQRSGRQLNFRILHCLEQERQLVAKFETAATMKDDVATGRRACEPDDSVSHGNLSITIPLPKMHQFITDESDRRSFHIGRGDV